MNSNTSRKNFVILIFLFPFSTLNCCHLYKTKLSISTNILLGIEPENSNSETKDTHQKEKHTKKIETKLFILHKHVFRAIESRNEK